jgi:hypothetical protein
MDLKFSAQKVHEDGQKKDLKMIFKKEKKET